MKNLPRTFQNISALRAITIVAAFLFIPAYAYGFVSIWNLLFGISMSIFFDARLRQIIQACSPIDPEKFGNVALTSRYFLLLFEISLIASMAPAIVLFFVDSLPQYKSSLDVMVLKYSPFSFATDYTYKTAPANIQLFVAATGWVFISFIVSFILSYKKLLQAGWQMFSKPLLVNGHEVKQPLGYTSIIYTLIPFSAFIVFYQGVLADIFSMWWALAFLLFTGFFCYLLLISFVVAVRK